MIPYLLSVTAIWLISLVLFDVFLRKESFHSYNRLYLLSTFCLSIAFPMFDWGATYELSRTAIALPVAQIADTRQTVATVFAGATSTSAETQINWWIVAYLAGAGVALTKIAIDLL